MAALMTSGLLLTAPGAVVAPPAQVSVAQASVSPAGLAAQAVTVTPDDVAAVTAGDADAPAAGADQAVSQLSTMALGAQPASSSAEVAPALLPAPRVAVPFAQLASLRGTRLLQQLAVQPRTDLARFFTGNPAAARALLAERPAPALVEAWWETLPAASRHTLRSVAPELVGNLDGIPVAARDAANRSVLVQKLDGLHTAIKAGLGRAELNSTTQDVDTLGKVRDALDGDGGGGAPRYLVSLGVDGEATAAIAVGDPATADDVTVMVPGMFYGVDAEIGSWTRAAADLHDAQQEWLSWLGGAHASDSVSVVAWIGYQAPSLMNIASLDLANRGSTALDGLISGLQALRSGDEPRLTVVAHSYGSTTALMSLTSNDYWIDSLAVVGSPGSDAKSVHDLHVRDGDVYVGEAQWDPIPNSATFGSDPGAPSYGAKRMSVNGGTDPLTHRAFAASVGHNDYFGADTEAMRNFALIGIGRGDLVTR